jgi:outer membrane immunogenic protein
VKVVLFAILGSLATAAVPALAADLPVKAPNTVVPVQAYNWTGFYVGVNAGGGWGQNDYSGTNTLGPVSTTFGGRFDVDGVFAGGQVGYNYQFANNWVAGIEADADWSRIRGTPSGCPTSGGIVTGCQSSVAEGDRYGTVRGRLGYAWNNFLLYGTGGAAWGHAKTTTTLSCVGPGCPAVNAIPGLAGVSSTASAKYSGSVSWAAGGGFEWGFYDRWTFRLEYLRLQFEAADQNFIFNGGGATLTSQLRADTGIDTVRVAINYRFAR